MSYSRCCVAGCASIAGSDVLHEFPNPAKHLDRFMTWVNCIGGDMLTYSAEYIYKNRRICRKHFERRYQTRNNRLSAISVPTIYMPYANGVTEATPGMLEQEQVFDTYLNTSANELDVESRMMFDFSSTPSPEAVPESVVAEDPLNLLCEAPEPEISFGKPIHKDVATSWMDLIKKGLTKEIKEKISKEYLIPSNCELLVPPILNSEVKAAILEPNVKQDEAFMYRQKQIANSLAALAPVVDYLVSKECNQDMKLKILKPIGDACKILCDMHHKETMVRKKLVLESVSAGLKETLVSSETDKYLFGVNMSEKIKTAKDIQRTSEGLKINQNVIQIPNVSSCNNNRKIIKKLHQRMLDRQGAGKVVRPAQQAPRPRGSRAHQVPPSSR